jgi:tRNA threonylcarbamoyladenosine biosynthesis protein TsaE
MPDSLFPAETQSATETMALGRAFGATLQPGDVVALYGDLGAGKTHFVKGVAVARGVEEADVSSPTFALVQLYDEAAGADLPLAHVDAYRLERPDQFVDIGGIELMDGDGAVLIEWPERVEELLPSYTIRLKLTHAGDDRRQIERLG